MLNVRYHVDRCTKDKGMIRILTHGLFSTCTKSSFLLYPNNIRLRAGVYLLTRKEKKKRIPLLGKAVPCSWWQILILSGPLLEVNYCLYPPCPSLTSPPHSLPATKDIYLHTGDINIPAASVGHTPNELWISKHNFYLHLWKNHVFYFFNNNF
jgi:hypothetical protein